MVRSNRGRQKIEIKKMENESNLQVTFSKRRFSLFKKASELCTLCGAEIMMIVFSPGGKVFSFGHPSVQHLIHHFLNYFHNPISFHQQNNNLQFLEARRPDTRIQFLNNILTQMQMEKEKEKEKAKSLNYIRECREKSGNCFEKDVKELDLNQTNHLICALEGMKTKLISEISEYSQVNAPQNYYMDQSSAIIGGPNDHGIDPRSVTFMNDNPNMVIPNSIPSFGYNNHGGIDPRSNMNHMSSYNFNES